LIASDARRQARIEAENLGIDAHLIDRLVEQFYGHIRSNALLGPIFDEAIGDRWDSHLATMKAFWSAVVFQDGGYSGRPMPAHMKLPGLTPDHFQTWLDLFRQTLQEIGATGGAATLFMERAERIAASFQLHLFHNPALR
jgi:hemoglobin